MIEGGDPWSAAATLRSTPALLDRPAPAGGRVLPQLDALRGVAILAVFVQHLGDRFMPLWEEAAAALGPGAPWALTVLHHAWWGVDLFFVVSGFSLALGYLRAFAAGRPPLAPRDFLVRRAARVLPAYAAAVALALAAHPDVAGHPAFGAALAAHAALLQGYVSPGGIVLIGASWSLTTES
ncbi:MAG TPA: acyltransferase family protein, partial [Candidatus Nanopelagicales bacterium]|nr:acyltransferase family protein [Candidatus Nanopelagicales bacterium]